MFPAPRLIVQRSIVNLSVIDVKVFDTSRADVSTVSELAEGNTCNVSHKLTF